MPHEQAQIGIEPHAVAPMLRVASGEAVTERRFLLVERRFLLVVERRFLLVGFVAPGRCDGLLPAGSPASGR